MKHLAIAARRMSALMTILLILSLGLFLPPAPKAAAYACGSSSDPASECYAAATWPGNMDGASTVIDIVPLYNSGSELVANQMWLKDTQSYGCTTYPFCWFEGGYAYAPYNGHSYYEYVAWINPAGYPNVQVLTDLPSGQTGTIYLAIKRYDPYHFNISYHSPNYYTDNMAVTVQYGMSPNYIQIGMRLSGQSGATSGDASFTNNCYFVGSSCYSQTNSGNPTEGYVSQPPFGYWKTKPSTQPGGTWVTSVSPASIGVPIDTSNYAQIWGLDAGSFRGVDVYVTTPNSYIGDYSRKVIAAPVAITDLVDHFIESGPEKRCDAVCATHPYWTYAVGNNIHTQEDTSVTLTPNGLYEYKSVNFTGTQWQAQFCDAYGCRGLITADLSRTSLPRVLAGGESATGDHFGTVTSSYAQEWTGYGSFTTFYCNYSINTVAAKGGSIDGCYSNTNSWNANY